MEKFNIKVYFNRNGELKKDGTGIVSICISYGGNRKFINTGIAVEPKYFDTKKERIKAHPQAQMFNNKIDDIIITYKKRYNYLYEKGDIFELEDILETDTSPKTDFIEFIKEQAQYKCNSLGESVKSSQQNAYKNLIDNLLTFANRKRIPFQKVNYDFIKKFDLFLKSAPINKGQPLHHNTRKKRHDILRSFVKLAYEDKLLESNPYDKFKYKAIPTTHDYLTDSELKQIEDMKPIKSIELTKDVFLFGCYTGLRFNDIVELTHKNITYDGSNVYLNTRENKTQKNKINLPLHKLFYGKPIALIEKYKSTERKTLFPYISATTINRNLKIIIMNFAKA